MLPGECEQVRLASHCAQACY